MYLHFSTASHLLRILLQVDSTPLPPAFTAAAKRLFHAASDMLIAPDGPWTCRVCTIKNAPGATVCSMCSTPSGATTSRQACLSAPLSMRTHHSVFTCVYISCKRACHWRAFSAVVPQMFFASVFRSLAAAYARPDRMCVCVCALSDCSTLAHTCRKRGSSSQRRCFTLSSLQNHQQVSILRSQPLPLFALLALVCAPLVQLAIDSQSYVFVLHMLYTYAGNASCHL